MEKQVKQVKLQKSNRILQFGAWMPTLLDRISKAVHDGRFTKPPRGPIGERCTEARLPVVISRLLADGFKSWKGFSWSGFCRWWSIISGIISIRE